MAFTNKFIAIWVLILTIWLLPALSRPLDDEYVLKRHEVWMAHHGRVYTDTQEKETRFNIFKSNLEYIENFNKGVNRGYKLSANKFADLTDDEFRSMYTGYTRQTSKAVHPTSEGSLFRNTTSVPESLDWRSSHAVTPVKNQHRCGCCWAFAAVAAIEGAMKARSGGLMSLSEQELLDCDEYGNNRGCDGGTMDNAFEFVKSNGLTTETNYPYTAEQGICKQMDAAVTITGYQDVPSNNEEALLQAVATQPVSVGIEASRDFKFYSAEGEGEAVFSGECGTNLNHAVTIIGYGTTNEGTKYWLIKNSWGTEWGENGYMKIQRDTEAEEGLCGLAMAASYPIL